jgi:hypothetical protein
MDPSWIVGSKDLSEISGCSVAVQRFDTLFSAIASRLSLQQNTKIIEVPQDRGEAHLKLIQNLGRSLLERTLLAVNLDLATIANRAWKRLGGLRPVNMPFIRTKFSFLVMRDCELLDEAFLPMLLKGAQYQKLAIPKGGPPVDFEYEGEVNELVSNLGRKFGGVVSKVLRPTLDCSGVVGELIGARILQALRHAKGFCDYLHENEDQLLKTNLNRKPTVLTNSLTSPKERLFGQWLRSRSIKVVTFEHGIAAGVGKVSHPRRDFDAMLESDCIICFNDCSREFYLKSGDADKKVHAVGLPDVMKRIRFPRLQKALGRAYVRVAPNKRLLGFVCQAFTNNMLIGPYRMTDACLYGYMRWIIRELLPTLPYTSCVKLYPTYRFLDHDPFLQIKSGNVRVVQFFEFRYLRAAFDLLITSSPFSTLGWVWATNIPVIYLDFPESPLEKETAKEFHKAIFRIDCGAPDWRKQLRSILEISQSDMLKLWEEKKSVRDVVGEKYIFGPPGKAGRNTAEMLIGGKGGSDEACTCD